MDEKLNPQGVSTSYFEYLTAGIDSGSPNILIEVATKILTDEYSTRQETIRIADVGCFTGSIANRIYQNTPDTDRNRFQFFGLDNDFQILTFAKKIRPHIHFVNYDLADSPPFDETFHIILISNVLHEIFSEHLPNKKVARKAVVSTLTSLSEMLMPLGYVLILDGIKPENPNRKILINLPKDELRLFRRFAESNFATPVKFKNLGDGTVETTIGGLAAFLTKAKYLDEDYWEKESKEVYQFFSINDYQEAMHKSGLKIVGVTFQPAKISRRVRILSRAEVPPKNVLIKAQKVNEQVE